jgi:hypothetical protein
LTAYEQKNIEEKDSTTILRTVPHENGFHFTTPTGTYTGTTALSIEDFADKLKTIEADSVAYHYYRGDIQRWIDDTLGDRDFANSLCFIQRGMDEEELRRELLKLLDKRIVDLKSLKWVETEGI